MPLWLATPIRPHDLGAQFRGSTDDALAVRSGEENVEFVGQRNDLVFKFATVVPCFAVTGGRQESGLHTLGRAVAQEPGVRRSRGADEDKIGEAVRKVSDGRNRLDTEHFLARKIRSAHTALIATRENVVHRDEAELAGMARCSGNEHAARLEECLEMLVSQLPAALRGCGWPSGNADLDQRIGGNEAALVRDEQGVEIDGQNVVPIGCRVRQTHQNPNQRFTLDCRLATESAEQFLSLDFVDHFVRIGRRDGNRSKDDVCHGLGQHSTDAKHDDGSELGVAHDARDELAVALDHRCDENAHRSIVFACRAKELGHGCREPARIADVQADKTAFGLVRDAIAVQLCNDGK